MGTEFYLGIIVTVLIWFAYSVGKRVQMVRFQQWLAANTVKVTPEQIAKEILDAPLDKEKDKP